MLTNNGSDNSRRIYLPTLKSESRSKWNALLLCKVLEYNIQICITKHLVQVNVWAKHHFGCGHNKDIKMQYLSCALQYFRMMSIQKLWMWANCSQITPLTNQRVSGGTYCRSILDSHPRCGHNHPAETRKTTRAVQQLQRMMSHINQTVSTEPRPQCNMRTLYHLEVKSFICAHWLLCVH